ncbi:MAG: hypothetical protein VW338_12220, partial [Rhodospirillaceae bacterium]
MTDLWDAAPVLGGTPAVGRQAQSIYEAVVAGLQSSATGLAVRGKLPEQQLSEDAPWYYRAASGAGNVVADLPLSVVGAVAGGAAGSAAAPGPGTLIGAAAGSFAVPMALRDALVEAYNGNHATSWQGVWEIAKAALKGGGKGAVIGGATAGMGSVAARGVGAVIAPGIGTAMTVKGAERVIGATALGTELATLTATSAAVEGHMPTWQDFMDNAILLAGMKGATAVASGLRNIYAETGRRPEQVAVDAQRDPAIKAALEQGQQPAAYALLALEQRIKAAVGQDPRPEVLREVMKDAIEQKKPLGEGARMVDWSYVTDADTLKGVLNATSELYRPEIERQRRGVVTNAQSVVEAKALLEAGSPAPHKVGAAGNSGEILARSALLRDALNHTYGELQKIAGVPEADLTPAMKLQALAAIERVSLLNAEFAGVRAEAGRALQIFRAIKRDPTLAGEANLLLNAAERTGSLQDIAALAHKFMD